MSRILVRDPQLASDKANDIQDFILAELGLDAGEALPALMVTAVRLSLMTSDPEQALNECADLLSVDVEEGV